MAVSCLVNGEEIGTYAPANADELRAATFTRVVETERTQGAAATTFIDDVRLLRRRRQNRKPPASIPPAGCLPPPQGMVAWWPGDGYAGDLLGGPVGVRNDAVSWAPGWVGQAFQFDSQGHVGDKGGRVTIPMATEIIGLQMLTVEAWVRLDPDPSAAGKIKRFVTIDGMATLRKESDGRLHFYMDIDGELRHIWSEIVPRERFVHVAGSYNGRVMRLYLDGQEVGKNEISGRVVWEGGHIGWVQMVSQCTACWTRSASTTAP